jgi:hypothetical protein
MQSDPSKSAGPLPAEPANKQTTVAITLLAILLLPALVSLYTQNPVLGAVSETIAGWQTTRSLVERGDLDLDEFHPSARHDKDPNYAVVWREGRLLGIEPLASALTFAPIAWGLGIAQGTLETDDFVRVSAITAALTTLLLLVWLLRTVPPGRAVLVTVIFALATSHRTLNASGLWQHTSSILWMVIGLWAWTHARDKSGSHLWAGVALAMATACRPILVPAAILVILDAYRNANRRSALITGAAVMAIGAAALAANYALHGSLLGGRAEIVSGIAQSHSVTSYFHFSPTHLLGMLAAPSRGLFVYSPVLLFALPGLLVGLRSRSSDPLHMITVAGLLIFALYGFIATWWAGWVFGPRYMNDLLPFFALWLAVAPPLRSRLARVAFVATLLWSLAAMEIGVRAYPCGWNARPANIDKAPERLWDPTDTELGRCLGRLLENRS